MGAGDNSGTCVEVVDDGDRVGAEPLREGGVTAEVINHNATSCVVFLLEIKIGHLEVFILRLALAGSKRFTYKVSRFWDISDLD